METREMLRLYDLHERRKASIPGFTRMESPTVLRMVDPTGEFHHIAWSGLDEESAERAIDAELEFFAARGEGFEWKLYSHDRPADLKERLAAKGFEIGEDEAIMALDLAGYAFPEPVLAGFEIRRIRESAALEDVARISRQVWGEDQRSFLEGIAGQLRDSPEYISLYVAYAGGEPVSSARINFPEGSPFASLWGGATLEAWRRRGIYSALLATRLREAAGRGYAYVTIDAGPMSRPIAEKKGFRLLSTSNPCSWKPA